MKKQNILIIGLILLAVISFGIFILVYAPIKILTKLKKSNVKNKKEEELKKYLEEIKKELIRTTNEHIDIYKKIEEINQKIKGE